jgi:hypothetical protein
MAILGGIMSDPPWRADIGDPFLLITVKILSDMLEEMVHYCYQSSTRKRIFCCGGYSAGDGAGGGMTA